MISCWPRQALLMLMGGGPAAAGPTASAAAAVRGMSPTHQQHDLAAGCQQVLAGSAATSGIAAAVAAAMGNAAAPGVKNLASRSWYLQAQEFLQPGAVPGRLAARHRLSDIIEAAEGDEVARQAGVPQLLTALLAEELQPAQISVALRHLLNNVGCCGALGGKDGRGLYQTYDYWELGSTLYRQCDWWEKLGSTLYRQYNHCHCFNGASRGCQHYIISRTSSAAAVAVDAAAVACWDVCLKAGDAAHTAMPQNAADTCQHLKGQ